MGITIHFKGKLNNPDLVNSVIDELDDISNIMNWEHVILNEDWDKPGTAKLKLHNNKIEITGHLPLKGIRIQMHPNCETFQIFFDKEGNLQDMIGMVLKLEGKLEPSSSYLSVKTQFAPSDIHISIIKLLKFLKKKYISDLKVTDEGEYWDTEDKNLLSQKISYLNEKMDMVEKIISSIQEELDKLPPEEAIKLLERTLKNKLK